MIGGTIVSNARLMKPLFYDGNFNRDGKKMRAVFEREISDGTVSYRLLHTAVASGHGCGAQRPLCGLTATPI